MDDCFEGQVNGLCGAAVLEALFLVTGLHTGHVPFTIDLCDTPPPLDDSWEDVVEVSFFVHETTADLVLRALELPNLIPLDLDPGNYRVRYCARGMDLAHQYEEPIDSYALIFCPDHPAEDLIIKQTSKKAAYWHKAMSESHSDPI